jgi:hypothetical protein
MLWLALLGFQLFTLRKHVQSCSDFNCHFGIFDRQDLQENQLLSQNHAHKELSQEPEDF